MRRDYRRPKFGHFLHRDCQIGRKPTLTLIRSARIGHNSRLDSLVIHQACTTFANRGQQKTIICIDVRSKLKRRHTWEMEQYSLCTEILKLQESSGSYYLREKQEKREKTSSSNDSRGHSLTSDRFSGATFLKLGGNKVEPFARLHYVVWESAGNWAFPKPWHFYIYMPHLSKSGLSIVQFGQSPTEIWWVGWIIGSYDPAKT